jgi:p-hydroxybenzoate 3-monooxygenase
VVLKIRTRNQLETTVRAGVLEHGTVDLLTETGLGERVEREGAVHHGIELRFGGRGYRIDLNELTGGCSIRCMASKRLSRTSSTLGSTRADS